MAVGEVRGNKFLATCAFCGGVLQKCALAAHVAATHSAAAHVAEDRALHKNVIRRKARREAGGAAEGGGELWMP